MLKFIKNWTQPIATVKSITLQLSITHIAKNRSTDMAESTIRLKTTHNITI